MITLTSITEILWKYYRPLWIERLSLPASISDEALKVAIHEWVEANPPEESQ